MHGRPSAKPKANEKAKAKAKHPAARTTVGVDSMAGREAGSHQVGPVAHGMEVDPRPVVGAVNKVAGTTSSTSEPPLRITWVSTHTLPVPLSLSPLHAWVSTHNCAVVFALIRGPFSCTLATGWTSPPSPARARGVSPPLASDAHCGSSTLYTKVYSIPNSVGILRPAATERCAVDSEFGRKRDKRPAVAAVG